MSRTGKVTTFEAFTLVELVVSMAIISILSGVLLWRFPESSTRINLLNLSHSLALTIREAQVRGAAVDSLQGAYAGYGVYFDLTAPDRFVLFGDLVAGIPGPSGIPIGDGLFATAPIDETKSTTVFPARFLLRKLCVGTSYPFSCNGAFLPGITSLIIVFIRPNPEPLIYVNGSKVLGQPIVGACIEMWSPQGPKTGHVRSVVVLGAGLISPSNKPCD